MTVPAALRFTYEDYLRLPEDRRYEIIGGDLFRIPAPTPYHQHVKLRLAAALLEHVSKTGAGEVLDAPCDVVLSATDVVQPDILYVGQDRLSIIGDENVSGAPELVVEVLSPSTAERDRTTKAKIYSRAGVQELWLVDPLAKTVKILRNSPRGFRSVATYGEAETLASSLLPGLEVRLAGIF